MGALLSYKLRQVLQPKHRRSASLPIAVNWADQLYYAGFQDFGSLQFPEAVG